MDVAGATVNLPSVVGLGVVVGFVAGMFGVGGGFLLTPLLSVFLGIPMPIAVGTGLCQMVGSSTVGLLRHRKLGNGEPRIAWVLVGGSLLGVGAGAGVVGYLETLGATQIQGQSIPVATLALYVAYLAFLLLVAGLMWQQASGGFDDLDFVRRGPIARLRLPPYVDLPSLPLDRVSVLSIAYIGVGVGFFSGLLGVGGGILLIPVLLYGVGFPFRHASGTGIAVTLITAVMGTLAHARAGHVHLGLALVLLVGSGISAQFGAIVTTRASARVLRKGLVALVVLTMVLILWDLARRIAIV